jgi:hypothetical protein
MTQMFIAAGGIPDPREPTFRRDLFRSHTGAITTLNDAGIHPPTEWTALLERYAHYIDLGDHAADRLAAEIVTPTGADLVGLRAAALAEQIGRSGDDAAINERVQGAVLRQLEAIYQPAARENYKRAAERYNSAGKRFAIAAALVDVEATGENLIAASAGEREAWLTAPALAAELDQALHVVFAAAALCDGVPADVAFATGATDLDTTEYQIALACDPHGAHRRKTWACFAKTDGRTGRWGALHALGVRIKAAPDPASVTPYARPVQPVAVEGPGGKAAFWCPHDGPLAEVMPGWRPVAVGWLEERPQTQAIP